MRKIIGAAAVVLFLPAAVRAATCDSLKALTLAETTIDGVQLVAAG